MSRLLTGIFCCVLLSGCIPFRTKQSSYHLILGLGLVRVERTNAVTVVNSDSLGLYAGDGRVNLGLSSIYSACVPTNAQVVLEIRK